MDISQLSVPGNTVSFYRPGQAPRLYIRHPDYCEEKIRLVAREQRDRDSLRELAEFLRKTAPPPSNYMSIPTSYTLSSQETKKWPALKALKRSKRRFQRRRSSQTQLVAETTSAGNRHIAIKTPDTVDKAMDIRTGLARGSKGRQGITILHPVAEDGESSASQSPASLKTRAAPAPIVPRGLSSTPGIERTRVMTSPVPLYPQYYRPPPKPPAGLPPLPALPHHRPRRSTTSGRPTTSGRSSNGSFSTPPVTGGKVKLPLRKSSLDARTSAKGHASIDGIVNAPIGYVLPNYGLFTHHGVANTVGANKVEPAVVTHAQTAKSVSSVPMVFHEAIPGSQSAATYSKHESQADSAQLVGKGKRPERRVLEFAPHDLQAHCISRQTKVRELKQRDMEASRSKRSSFKEGEFALGGRPTSSSEHTDGTIQNSPGQQLLPSARLSRSATRQSQFFALTPIMVVADVKPTTPPPSPGFQPASTEHNLAYEAQPQIASYTEAHRASPIDPLPQTPPHSPCASTCSSPPKRTQILPNLDRTSLAHQSGWNTERGDDPLHNKQFLSKETKAPRTRIRTVDLDRDELMVRYENLRDHHVLELEERLHRLEQNGETWFTAMLPVLNELSNTLGRIHEDNGWDRGRRGWGELAPLEQKPVGIHEETYAELEGTNTKHSAFDEWDQVPRGFKTTSSVIASAHGTSTARSRTPLSVMGEQPAVVLSDCAVEVDEEQEQKKEKEADQRSLTSASDFDARIAQLGIYQITERYRRAASVDTSGGLESLEPLMQEIARTSMVSFEAQKEPRPLLMDDLTDDECGMF